MNRPERGTPQDDLTLKDLSRRERRQLENDFLQSAMTCLRRDASESTPGTLYKPIRYIDSEASVFVDLSCLYTDGIYGKVRAKLDNSSVGRLHGEQIGRIVTAKLGRKVTARLVYLDDLREARASNAPTVPFINITARFDIEAKRGETNVEIFPSIYSDPSDDQHVSVKEVKQAIEIVKQLEKKDRIVEGLSIQEALDRQVECREFLSQKIEEQLRKHNEVGQRGKKSLKLVEYDRNDDKTADAQLGQYSGRKYLIFRERIGDQVLVTRYMIEEEKEGKRPLLYKNVSSLPIEDPEVRWDWDRDFFRDPVKALEDGISALESLENRLSIFRLPIDELLVALDDKLASENRRPLNELLFATEGDSLQDLIDFTDRLDRMHPGY